MAAHKQGLKQLEKLATVTSGELVVRSDEESGVGKVTQLTETQMVLSDDDAMPWEDAGYWLIYLLALVQLMWFRKGWVIRWR
ncbi:hypothetical protein [Vibrio paucivorans]|uniref:Uncharacterized protein n=1 Tax=Vibrio paucivorans TaxID=2829489 RepID=A0A9X3CBI1_9VIBR|nr:hypothetical protein [Vibrio paucivorans]MCW8332626.1 hypothetical protein [Vibrio paucivorans]